MNLFNYLFGEKEDTINNIEIKVDNNQLKEDTNTNIQNEIAMGCCCEPCDPVRPPDCSNSVPFQCTIIVPAIFNLPLPPPQDLSRFVSIAWNDDCLECIMDKCELNAIVDDPCRPGTPLPDCKACVKRFRYVGCIKFIACLSPITGEGPSTTGGVTIPNSTACASGTCCVCVNQVICFTCDCDDMCPSGNLISGYTITSAIPTRVCENNVICVSGTFNFVTTPCAPASAPACCAPASQK
ncbi:hypothetical protein CPJCM30710_07090 [Clostridium polyendosporum]|uniref:Uncharacterized protein n=1 Tax=Clostridium polyendosporum TaxID=69208 RepID=A0A919RZX0_9CLOT|nr:hypothetical protein [Clostridium polyendosporum]GIM28043.1 hypothetical protein CPJCM30710_07090 [Clostridium polyendosporum]